MPFRINVKFSVPDARSTAKRNQFNNLGLSGAVADVNIVDSYTIDKQLNQKQRGKALELLVNPLLEKGEIIQEASDATTSPHPSPHKGREYLFDWVIEIGFLPGVTDNVGNTARETLEDGLKIKFKNGENVYSSQIFFVQFNSTSPRPSPHEGRVPAGRERLQLQNIQKIVDSLYNPLIQQAKIKSFEQFKKDGGMGITVPLVKLPASPKPITIDLNINDEELAKIGKQGVMDPVTCKPRGPLSLDLENLKVIRDYFNSLGRKPTDVELESLAQTWSEHCKHTIFADPIDEVTGGLYKTYIKAATNEVRKKKASKAKDFCVSVFTDNAGGINFDNDYVITHKVETHNSPSALDPFGGAITGIVGVNRDAMGYGMGAKPVINVYGYCLADPNDKKVLYRDEAKTQKLLPARRIMDGVIAGVNAGGNQSGIPTNQGFVYFDSRYRGKPLVFAGTVGLIPKKIRGKDSSQKQAKPGDLIVMAGGRVGQDGIHGATFSSESLNSGSPAAAVQIGDPITQKKMSDAIVKEARDLGLYNSITDDGAGGLSCSVAEMAKESNGCEVNLDKVPLKYPGMEPWQTWISESQERMTLAVPKKNWKKFSALMKKRGVEATVIGKFTKSGKCVVKSRGEKIMDVEMEFLHDGRVQKQLSTRPISVKPEEIAIPVKDNYSPEVLSLLKTLNITSYEFISKQYDHEVQGSSVTKPLQGRGRINADATVTRPVLNSAKGAILSVGINPSYSDIHTYHMAACAIDAAISKAAAAGADVDYLALLDNFCWSSSNEPERLAQLKDAVRACYDYATAFETPFISGKDSMFNDFKGFDEQGNPIKISVPPTLLISAIGIVPDIKKTVTLDAKMPGDLIYILGETHNELGGSEFYKLLDATGVNIPKVDALKNRTLYKNLYRCTQKDLVASAISVNRGGLATALSKMLIGGSLGGEVNLDKLPGNATQNYQKLFSESHGRILVTIDPKKKKEFEKLMEGSVISQIGKVTNGNILIKDKSGKIIVNLKPKAALEAYKATFKNY